MGGQLLRQTTSTQPSIRPVSGTSQSRQCAVKLNVRVINPAKRVRVKPTYFEILCVTKFQHQLAWKKRFNTVWEWSCVWQARFPIGYVKGRTKVWIRNESDVQDVWNIVHCSDNVSLWCHGVHISLHQRNIIPVKAVVKVMILPQRNQ